MPVAEESKELTAFRVNGEVYQFRRMPFGLTNAPATFQRLINGIFAGMKGLSLQVFLDDVCIATDTWCEHLEMLQKVFQLIIKANLKLKGSKCCFGTKSVSFLGHLITPEGVKPDPYKVKAFVDLPTPCDVQEVRRVLGAFNYYRKFIPNFAAITEPLVNLTRKGVKFDWSERTQNAFGTIKRELVNCATLGHLNATDPVILKTDASGVGVAGIILQQQNYDWRIIACASRHLKPAEKNYPPIELEALAVIYSLSKFRHYLLGRQFTVVTDHSALCAFNKKTPQNARLQRWALALAEYDCKFVHQKGTCHLDVDCLSRAPVDTPGDDYLDKILNINLRKTHKQAKRITQSINSIRATPVDIADWVSNHTSEQDKATVAKAANAEEDFQLIDGLVYKNRKLYVPLSKRKQILNESHSTATAAHDGVAGTLHRLGGFWWPKMQDEVADLVARCDSCQRSKAENKQPAGVMRKHEAFAPLDTVAFDYVGPLPPTVDGFNFIAVIVDHFTHYVVAKPMVDQKAEPFARFFMEFIGIFGPPRVMLSDEARCFSGKNLQALRNEFNVTHVMACPGYSKGNAVVERVIRTINVKCRALCEKGEQLDWAAALPMICLSINSQICSTTKYAPYELMFGRPAPILQRMATRNTTVYDLHHHAVRQAIDISHADAIANSFDAHQAAERYTKERDVQLNIDDLVLVKSSSRPRKHEHPYIGPFKVKSKTNDIYDLVNVDNKKDIRRRHISQLKVYKMPVISIILVTLLMSLVVMGLPQLHETSPVWWEEVPNKFISERLVTLPYAITYVSPCNLLNEYKRILTTKIINKQQPRVNTINSFPPQTIPQLQHNLHSPQPQPQPQPQQVRVQQTMPVAPRPAPVESNNPDRGLVPIEIEVTEPPVAAKEQEYYTMEEAIKAGKIPPFKAKRQITVDAQTNELLFSCEKVFKENIIQTISRFEQQRGREKRQIQFLAGIIVSNIVSYVEKKWTNQQKAADTDLFLRQSIAKLEQQEAVLNVATRASNKAQKFLQKEIDDLFVLEQVAPMIQAYYDYLVNEIGRKRMLLEIFLETFEQKKQDSVNLAQLFDLHSFDQLEHRDAKVNDVTLTNTNTLHITIQGHVRSKTSKIYLIRHVDFYTNFALSPTRHAYVGKPLVLSNKVKNCVRGLDQTATDAVESSCEEENFSDPNIKLWRETSIDKSKPIHSKMEVAWPNLIISCYGNNISIALANSPRYE